MNITHKIGELYANYLKKENQKNTNERYVGREHFYHASGTGMCSRKLYFQSVDKVKPTNLPNNASMRKMRIGTLLHQDIQNSLLLYNNIYNNITNHNINGDNITKKNNEEIEKYIDTNKQTYTHALHDIHTRHMQRCTHTTIQVTYHVESKGQS